MAENLDESDRSTGFVELGGHGGSILRRTLRQPAGDIDCRHGERHYRRLAEVISRAGNGSPGFTAVWAASGLTYRGRQTCFAGQTGSTTRLNVELMTVANEPYQARMAVMIPK